MGDPARYNALAQEVFVLVQALAGALKGGGIGSAVGVFQALMAHYPTISQIVELGKDPAARRENLSDLALELADVASFEDPSAVLKGIKDLDPAKLEAFSDAMKALIDDLI